MILPREQSALGTKFVRFLLVGGIATIVHYTLLIVLVESFHVGAVEASTIGFILSSILNYRLNYSFTFASRASHRITYPRFLSTTLVGLIFNATGMYILVDVVRANYILSQIVATSVTLIWNFIINSIWSFRS